MGFVDGQPRDAEAAQPAHQPLASQPLGRDEEQTQIAGIQPVPGLGGLALAVHGIERGGGDARPRQLPDLVAHQGNQRGTTSVSPPATRAGSW